MIRTRTRAHAHVAFANPHLRCVACRQPATGRHDDAACGCGAGSWHEPCGHRADYVSVCPSWSPVDGCTCTEPHREPK